MTTELVNKSTGEAIAMPAIATGENFTPISVIDVRTDFSEKKPQFSISGISIGNAMSINIINMRTFMAMPSAVYTTDSKFTQIIGRTSIAGKDMMVCVTFGGNAAEQVEKSVTALAITGGTIRYVAKLELSKNTGKNNFDYGVVNIEAQDASQADIQSTIAVYESIPNAENQFSKVKRTPDGEAE